MSNDRPDPKAFSEFLASRRSTRDFKSTPVPDALIEKLLSDGLTAPSWSNTRPFMVAVASGEVRERISREMQRRWWLLAAARAKGIAGKIKLLLHLEAAPRADYNMFKPYPKSLQPRSRRVGKELYAALGVGRGDKKARDEQWARNYEFFGAPTELFIFIHKDLDVFAASDAALFAENLILSAHAHGLGTCAQGAAGMWPSIVRKEFKVPAGYKLLYGIAIGYASDHPVNKFGAHRIGPDEIRIPLSL